MVYVIRFAVIRLKFGCNSLRCHSIEIQLKFASLKFGCNLIFICTLITTDIVKSLNGWLLNSCKYWDTIDLQENWTFTPLKILTY